MKKVCLAVLPALTIVLELLPFGAVCIFATSPTERVKETFSYFIKERPLSSGASDRKASQPIQPAHRQNVEKVVSQETRQNYKAERTTKAQTFEQSKRTTKHTEKNRNLVMKKGQKKK